jgi:N,N-dimethylformamidase
MSDSTDGLWPLLAYGDQLSVEPGATVHVMVSSSQCFRSELVRLGVAGAPDLEQRIPSAIDATWPGRIQPLRPGSHVRTSPLPSLAGLSYTIQAWIYPTVPGGSAQTVIAQGHPQRRGWALDIDEDANLRLREWSTGSLTVSAQVGCVEAHTWYFVAVVVDCDERRVRIVAERVSSWRGAVLRLEAEVEIASSAAVTRTPSTIPATPVLIGACADGDGAHAVNFFNGKIESPRLFRAALHDGALRALHDGVAPTRVAGGVLVAGWNMARALDSVVVPDESPNGANGLCVNMPTRAVTGHAWTGDVLSPANQPESYAAIHFHDDDLEDASWIPDLAVGVTDDLQSGLHAVKLTSKGYHAYVPFYVRASEGAQSTILFLAPTNTYLAYGNHQVAAVEETPELRPIDEFLVSTASLGRSLYDTHRDGSGVSLASRLRPIPNIDPRYVDSLTGAPRHFAADVHLLSWFDATGHDVDVATDEDLHRDGLRLLAPYQVVVTGSHPEYASGAMLDALRAYLGAGGNLMYLGGNGFYWVTSFHPERPHVIEVRRGFSGTRNWQVAVGEEHHSTTGERGGLWRHRGRPSHGLVGVGTTGHGLFPGVAYRRLEASYSGHGRVIFEGVTSETFGEFGLFLGGAAGDEIDAADFTLGTPPHAAILARSEPLPGYSPMMEDELWYRPDRRGEHNPKIRSELVFFETGCGGAVFSAGSINWGGALVANGGSNDVSRITRNVLEAFLERSI